MFLSSYAYSTYAQVLGEIYAVVDEIDSAPHGLAPYNNNQASSSGIRCRPDYYQQDQSHRLGNSSLRPGAGPSKSTNQSSERDEHTQRYQKSRLGSNATVIHGDKPKRPKSKKVDCPIYKYHIMHGISPSCDGCGRVVMSQVRSHVNRVAHYGYSQFLEQCRRCKEDFVDGKLLDDHRTANHCDHRPQLRGDIIIPWARLYLAIFPDASRVPLPCKFS